MITCNTFHNNKYGIQVVNNAYPNIPQNNFTGNSAFALYSTNSGELDAASNWWNDENGPNYNGEETSGNINAEPWLAASSECVSVNTPTNMPPFAPYDPAPVDNAINVVISDNAVSATWKGLDPNSSDTLVYDVYLGTSADSLALKGDSVSVSGYRFSDLAAGITYFWKVVARDSAGEETHSPVWQFTTAGTPPDLTINSLSWSPNTLTADQEVTITLEVKNTGSGPSVESFQVSLNIDGALSQTWTIDNILPAGQSKTLTHTWTAKIGDHTVQAVADSGQSVAESLENNNTLLKTITGIKDPEPPVLVSTVPADGSHLQTVNTAAFTLADTHGQVDDDAVISSVKITQQEGQTISGTVIEKDDTFTFTPAATPLSDAIYTVSLTAADTWGNTTDYSFAFTVDNTPPQAPTITGCTVDSGTIRVRPVMNKSSNQTISLTGTREEGTRVRILVQTDPLIENTGTIRHVGAFQPYTTIQGAIDAADNGDMILIDPGTYPENVQISKWVNLKGNSTNPENIIIQSPGSQADGYPATLVIVPASDNPLSTPVYVEGLQIVPYPADGNRAIDLPVTEAAGKPGTIVFNLCRFTNAGSNTYAVGGFGADGLEIKTKVNFINCYFQERYAHFREMHAANWTLEKCRLNDAYNCDACTTEPLVSDYVISDTQEYGTGYGSWCLGQMAASSVDFGSGDWALDLTPS
nr:CARDB domain-containing protein [uncultured Desulfobacter sp.]